MKRTREILRPAARLALLAAVTALPFAARAQTAIPAAPDRWVTDQVGFLSPQTRTELDRRLEAYERSSGGHQIVVWIGGSLGQQSLEDWAARTFESWGVGRKGLDDGAAIFLFAQDRKVRIEVGYGLEDRLTDLRAARIIREEMVPRLARGDRDGAVTAAVDSVLAAAGGESTAAERQPAVAERRASRGSLVLFGILGIIFLFLLVTNPSLAVYTLMSLSGGGRGGGWGRGGGFSGGGGGFSGGGGRSGGGGASGSW